jgi:succinate dehydrogenase / fumarate reductase cytochrome b subunit
MVVAVTGLLLVGFVVMHLAGNLLIFRGPDALNAYAYKMRALGPLLWVVRAGLLSIALLHVVTAIQLAMENRRARPVGYRIARADETTLAARTMALSGLLLLAYLAYHLLHFTVRVTHPDISHLMDGHGRHDVYAMVVLSFRDPLLSLGYIGAMGLLCSHLSHGAASFLQTLGLTTDRTLPIIRRASRLFAAALFVGYSLIPAASWLGWLPVSVRS